MPKLSSWNKNQTEKLYTCFRDGLADPGRQDTNYIRRFAETTPWVQEVYPIHKISQFYKIYRRHAATFISEEAYRGARKSKLNYLLFYPMVSKSKLLVLSIFLRFSKEGSLRHRIFWSIKTEGVSKQEKKGQVWWRIKRIAKSSCC